MNNQVRAAAKWSFLTEISAKALRPVSNMILARLLMPDEFAAVATVNMVFSFADILSDAGFSKYIIQKEFKDQEEETDSVCVALWSNLVVSLCLWLSIWLFSEPIAVFVGNPELSDAIAISCCILPVNSFATVQLSVFRRNFEYRALFLIRIVYAVIPLFVTVPLAFLLRNYWALIIGMIAGSVSNAMLLNAFSKKTVKLKFDRSIFTGMLYFSAGSFLESMIEWMLSNIDVFLLGVYLPAHYLGLYKTTMNTIAQIVSLISSAILPLMFSSLSRLQNSGDKYKNEFLRFQRIAAFFLIPMGCGIFLYREFVTGVLLGANWSEAADFIGIWGLAKCVMVLNFDLTNQAFRAWGKPYAPAIVNLFQLFILVPGLIRGIHLNFDRLCILRAALSLVCVGFNLILVKRILRLSPCQLIYNVSPYIWSSAAMAILAHWLKNVGNGILWNIFSAITCFFVYAGSVYLSYKRK